MSWGQRIITAVIALAVIIWLFNAPHAHGVEVHDWIAGVVRFASGLGTG